MAAMVQSFPIHARMTMPAVMAVVQGEIAPLGHSTGELNGIAGVGLVSAMTPMLTTYRLSVASGPLQSAQHASSVQQRQQLVLLHEQQHQRKGSKQQLSFGLWISASKVPHRYPDMVLFVVCPCRLSLSLYRNEDKKVRNIRL